MSPSTAAPVALESAPCPLGCPAGDNPVLVGRDRLYDLPGDFTVVRCQTCGLMRTDPRPTPGTMGFYYPDEYGPYQGTRVDGATAPGPSRNRWRRRLRQAIRMYTDCLPDVPAGRLLEVGCASGAFLHRMAARGWDVEGIEFSPTAAAAAGALGYPVHVGLVEMAPPPSRPYDLVVGWMVLEHLHDPVLALRKLYAWTRPDGWLAVSVPNAGSLELTLFKARWYGLHLPNHLFHYTPRTLARVLDASGWRLERVFHQRVLSNAIASTGFVLRECGVCGRLAEWLVDLPVRGGRTHDLLYPLAWLLAAFGQTGRMTAWARRTP